LKALYESTNGDNWTNRTSWDVLIDNQNSPPSACNLGGLYGIELDVNGRVSCIDLDGNDDCGYDFSDIGNNLNGTIPAELASLSHLISLCLASNQLSGTIPVELGDLNSLEELRLYRNELTGNIPTEISNLTNLTHLSLSFNGLMGSIPNELESLIRLEELWLGFNEFIGDIPIEVTSLNELRVLSLRRNNLTGNIPSELNNLTKLKKLQLDANQLEGSIPPELGDLVNLTDLLLSYNQLEGTIPVEISNLANLTHLELNSNMMTGNIPIELQNLTALFRLDLSSNLLEGAIPIELTTLSSLSGLYLQENNLSGEIPNSIGNLVSLAHLWLSANELNGRIPTEIGNLTNLNVLSLSDNQLTGNIPSEFTNLTILRNLYLTNNNLTGSIPVELQNPNLTLLRLSGNQLTGNIPSEICSLTSLTDLQLFDNQLSSCYPSCMDFFCEQLINPYIDGDNNFDATWEDFCATGAGTCIDDCQADCETNVYPGDLNHDGEVDNQDVALSGLYLNNYGIPRAQQHQNIDWYPHPSQDWGFENNQNVDLKHHDCNGDGQLDENDQQAVQTNMGFTWGDQETDESPPESDYLVLLSPIEQVIDDYLIINVVLERRANADLEVQAGYFTIDYSEIEENISFVTLGFFDESWLGERDVNVWYESTEFSLQNKIDVGFTKTDNVSSNGSGAIGQLILAFDNSGQKKANSSYQFSVSNIGIHNNNAQFTLVENQLLQVNIDNPCQPNWNIDEDTPFQNLYASNSNLTTTGFVLIGAAQEVEYKANRTRLNSGFKVKAGASFKAGYGGCD